MKLICLKLHVFDGTLLSVPKNKIFKTFLKILEEMLSLQSLFYKLIYLLGYLDKKLTILELYNKKRKI